MLKIHPGFKAIAILLGPACLIMGHQKLSAPAASDRAAADPEQVLHRIYLACAERPKLQRTVQCDRYVRHVERCSAGKMRSTGETRCDPRSSYEILMKLDFSPPLRLPPVDTISVTAGANG